MGIKFQIFGRVFNICIGHRTDWFEQISLITVVEEFYAEDKTVEYAVMVWRV
jgi:hypothetical protein